MTQLPKAKRAVTKHTGSKNTVTKLTGTQCLILTAGAQRAGNLAMPLPKGLAGADLPLKVFPQYGQGSDPRKGTDNEASKVHGRADHWHFAGARGGGEVPLFMPQARHVGGHVLCVEEQVRRHDGVRGQAAEGVGSSHGPPLFRGQGRGRMAS